MAPSKKSDSSVSSDSSTRGRKKASVVKKIDPELVDFVDDFKIELAQRSREVEEQIEEIAANRMQEMFNDIERLGQIYDLSMPLEEFFAAMARGDKEPCPRLKKDPVIVKEEPLSAEEDEVKKEKPEVEEEDEVVVPADPIAEATSLPATPQFPDTIHPKKSVKPRKPILNEPVFSANGTPLVFPLAVNENMLASPAAAEPMEYKDCD